MATPATKKKNTKKDEFTKDPIIMKQEWFDCPQNSQEEEEEVLKILRPKLETITIPDLFTGFVIECLAVTCFGEAIGSMEPPNPETDDPETYRDKVLYFAAKEASDRFKSQEWLPIKEKIFLKTQMLVIKNPEMKTFHNEFYKLPELYVAETSSSPDTKNLILLRSAEKNDMSTLLVHTKDTNRWKCIHNIYHLPSYIGACVLQRMNDQAETSLINKNLYELWKEVATEMYYKSPVSLWDDLSGFEFIDSIKELFSTFEYIKKSTS